MQKLMLLIGILLASSAVVAQSNQEGKQRDGVKLEKYKERLDLTDAQVADWKEMKAKYRPELKEIRSNESQTKADKMRASADVMEQQEEALAQILSEDQFAELQIIREEVKQKRKEGKGKRKKGN